MIHNIACKNEYQNNILTMKTIEVLEKQRNEDAAI